jgi:trk system potassium uptake protein TrkH
LNWNGIGNLLGRFLIFMAATMALPVAVAIYFDEWALRSFLISAFITFFVGILIYKTTKKISILTFKDGCTLVTLGWVSASVFGALPFHFAGVTPSYIDAIFETMSGFTTTGASIFKDVEILPNSLLFWRALTQWLGGMGIIVLFITLLPNVGSVAMNLFKAEVPGPSTEKVKPRIQGTGQILWLIYFFLTIIQIILLMIFGMPFLEAVNHTFATLATGGFGFKNDSVAGYNVYIQYTITLFMIISGVNFSLYYFVLKNGIKNLFKDAELKLYLAIIGLATGIVTLNILPLRQSLEESFRQAIFQVGSVITTTGFTTVNYDVWPVLAKFLLLLLMFIGGCAGSTAGGMKVGRFLILFKNTLVGLKQILHPNAVYSIRINGKPIPKQVVSSTLQFFFLYILIFVIATAYMCFLGYDFPEAMGSVAATLNNVGPSFGAVGPVANYADVPYSGKILLTFLMLLGRLELFTVLIMFLPDFWNIRIGRK